MDARGVIRNGMGGASIALGVAGIVKPSLLGRLTGAGDEEARGLGFRDLIVGVGIFASPRVGLAQRAIADLGDAVVFVRRKPIVAVVAVVSAATAAVAAAAER